MKTVQSPLVAFKHCLIKSCLTAISNIVALAGLAQPSYADSDLISNLGLELLSVGPNGKANDRSAESTISGDGRFVGFYSGANNLFAGDDESHLDIDYFIKDRSSGIIDSLRLTDENGRKIPLQGYYIRLSGDGRHALIEGNNYSAFGASTVLLRVDLADKMASIVSLDPQGNLATSYHGAISYDGRFVVFSAFVDQSVYLYDAVSGRSERISIGINGALPNDSSYDTDVSADGNSVVFSSLASNLSPGDSNKSKDIFLWRRGIGITLVSRASNGLAGNGNSEDPSISQDGLSVAFRSDASNLIPGAPSSYFLYSVPDQKLTAIPDIQTKNVLVAPYGPPKISGNGERIFFTAGIATDLSGNVVSLSASAHIFVFDRKGGQTKVLERVLVGNRPNGYVRHLSPSFDGDRLAFTSSSSNLDPYDVDGDDDVYEFSGITRALAPTPTPTVKPDDSSGASLGLTVSRMTFKVGRSVSKRLRSNPPGATFKLGTLPKGLRYSRGVISGRPTRIGTTRVLVTLTRNKQKVKKSLTVIVTR